jgi:hypothetical protein
VGTNAYDFKRTSKLYVVEQPDDFDWEYVRSNIINDLKAIDKDKSNDWEFSEENDIKLNEELRSYPATSIGWFYQYIEHGGLKLTLTLIPKTVSGYADGFCLDFELQLEDEYNSEPYTYNEADEGFLEAFLNECIYQEPDKKGLFKIHSKRFFQKVQDAYLDGQNILEKIFSKYTDQYNYLGSFSNGEAIYERTYKETE